MTFFQKLFAARKEDISLGLAPIYHIDELKLMSATGYDYELKLKKVMRLDREDLITVRLLNKAASSRKNAL